MQPHEDVRSRVIRLPRCWRTRQWTACWNEVSRRPLSPAIARGAGSGKRQAAGAILALDEFRGRGGRQALHHHHKVVSGIGVVGSGICQHDVDNSVVFPGFEATEQHPVLRAQLGGKDQVLDAVGVDLQDPLFAPAEELGDWWRVDAKVWDCTIKATKRSRVYGAGSRHPSRRR